MEDENCVAAELDGDKLPLVFGVGNFFFFLNLYIYIYIHIPTLYGVWLVSDFRGSLEFPGIQTKHV